MELRSFVGRLAKLVLGCAMVLGALLTQSPGFVTQVSAGISAPVPIKACVIVDGNDPGGNTTSELYQSVKRVLEYNRIPWDNFDVNTANPLTLADGANPRYSTVIILAIGTEISDARSNIIVNATALGTGVVATRPDVANTTLDTIFGIQTLGGGPWINFDSLSIVANAFSLAYENGDSISQPGSALINHQLAGGADVVVTARSGTNDYPSIWVNTYQEARTVYFNNNAMYTWYFQGLLLQGILYAMPMGLASPINAGAIEVDDTPRSFYNDGDVQSYHYNFVNNFLEFIEAYNLDSTFFISFSYNNDIGSFWMYPQSIDEVYRYLNAGYEIGLHCGTIHIPLALGPDYPWVDQAGINAEVLAIAAAFQELSLRLQAQYGFAFNPADIVSYVAAANNIDASGYQALDQLLPSLLYVGTDFDLEEGTRGGSSTPQYPNGFPITYRDFGYEESTGLYNLPRSQGDFIVFSPHSETNTPAEYASAIANLKTVVESGQPYLIFTHPDENLFVNQDLYPNTTMEQVFSGYEAFADYVVENYPFYRWLQAAEIGNIMVNRASALNATWLPATNTLQITGHASNEMLQVKTGLFLTAVTSNAGNLTLTFSATGPGMPNDQYVFKQGNNYFIYTDGTGNRVAKEPTTEFTFTPTSPPSITTGNATAIAGTSATLNFNLTDFGSAEPDSAQVFFQYGYKKNAAGNILFENTTSPSVTRTATGSFGIAVSDLLPGRTYFFRAVALTTDGADNGEIASLESAGTPVVIIAGTATAEGGTPLGAATVKINGVNKGLTNGDGTYSVTNETAGDLIINISKTGYQAESQTVPTVITNYYIVDFTGVHALKALAAPVVTQQPAPTTVVYGNNAEFTAAASGVPTPTIKWQESIDSGAHWTDIPGATSATLTVQDPSVGMTGRQYRAVFSNNYEGVGVRTAESSGATLTVTPKPLNVTGITAAEKGYDGTTVATINHAAAAIDTDDLEPGDLVTLNHAAAVGTFATKHAGEDKSVNITGLILGGADVANYTLAQTTATADITPRPISVSATTHTKVYNGSINSTVLPTIIAGNIVAGDTFGFIQTFDNKNVGTAKVLTPSGTVNDGNGGANYAVTFLTNNTGAITAKPITVTANALSKVYGSQDPATLTYSAPGIESGDTLTGILSRAAGEIVGVYAISQGTLINASNPNYAITFVPANFSITPKQLTVTGITALSRQYTGDTTATINTDNAALQGKVGTDEVTLVKTGATGAFADKHVALTPKTVNISGLVITGDDIGNYTLVQPTTTANMTPRLISVTAVTDTKVYDGGTASTGVPTLTAGSIMPGDTLGFTQGFNNKNVGTGKSLIPSGAVIDGNNGQNYTVTLVNNTTGVITAKPITVTAEAKTRQYGTPDPALTFTAPGVAAGDTLSGALTRAAGTAIGTYAINQGTVTSANNPNYTITFVGANFTITKKELIVTGITAANKAYDGSVTATINVAGATLVGKVGSDVVTLTTTGATGVFANPNSGSQTVNINGMTIDGADVGNYSLTQTTATATITKVALTATADNKTITAGNPDPAFTVTYTGFVNSETASVLNTAPTASVTGAHTATGSYPIVVSGGTDNNYNFTYVNGTLTVNAAQTTGGGGGGGGFGNQLVGINLSGTSPWMDGNGRAITTGQIHTQDNKLSLTIPIGTAVWNAAGAAQGYLSAAALIQPPVAPPQNSLVIAWEMGPNGVMFTPAITLTVNYAESDVPAGTSEADLYIAWWDGSQWVKLQSTVDTAANTVSAQVSHFTTFALMAKQTPPPTTTQPPPTTTQPPPTTTQSPPTTSVPYIPATTQPAEQKANDSNFIAFGTVGLAVLVGSLLFWRSRRPMR